MVWLPDGKKILRICITVYTQYRRVTDEKTDRQTDRQISCHVVVRAMHTHRAVKIAVTAGRRYTTYLAHFCRAMLCLLLKRGYYIAGMRCPFVCPSVTFSCANRNKDIFEIFSPSGSQAILVFPHQTGWRYSDGNPPNGGVEYRWGRQKTRF